MMGKHHHGSSCVRVFWHQFGTTPLPSQPKGRRGKVGGLTTLHTETGRVILPRPFVQTHLRRRR
jgi:hypothetical protein